MWLFVIEVIAVIIASMRGWGAKPILILGGTMLFGFFLGSTVVPSSMGFLQTIDYLVVIILVIMAITGKKKQEDQSNISGPIAENTKRIQCPQCAEWIMPDAKLCRFCGCEINKETDQNI